MVVTLELTPSLAVGFLLVLARVGGLMFSTPFLGSAAIPRMTRVALSLSFALVVFPLVQHRVPTAQGDFFSLLLVLAGELVIGLLLGLVGQLFMGTLQMAGQMMGFQVGFGVINLIDPQTQVETSVLSTFQSLLGIMVFLLINAHHWFIRAVLESYDLLTPRGLTISGDLITQLIRLSSGIFKMGFQLAAPVIVVLAIVDILLGVLGRAAPQIHILIVGMPVKVMVGLFFLSASFSILIPAIARYLGHFHAEIYRLLTHLAS
ncbi:MAG: flagellar biosynthetic protein FliR [Acidobacteriota bacterium]